MPANQPPFDYQKWLHELQRRDAERAHDRNDAFFDSVNRAAIDAGNLAFRMALLVNGGAAVALLSFVGGLAADQKRALAPTLVWFAWGVVAAGAGIAFTYFTNYCMTGVAYSQLKQWKHPYLTPGPATKYWQLFNIIFHLAAVAAGLSSLGFFIAGMFTVSEAISRLP
jgi:hypothetical protein